MRRLIKNISAVTLLCFFACEIQCNLEELYRWKQIEFDDIASEIDDDTIVFPGDKIEEESDFNNYVPFNNLPMGVEHHKGRIFITIPRRRFGIPSSLNFIDMNVSVSEQSPKFKPYPNFETNKLQSNLQPNPDRIISVYRTRTDSCNRLWFVDTGLLEIPDNRKQIQRPSIWVIDLNTNQRVRRFEIPKSVAEFGDGFVSITVDSSSRRCGDAFAYIPDFANRRLSVYSFRQNKLWSFNHNYFSFDPIQGDFNIGGFKFRRDDGIFSITLGPAQRDGYRTAYFTALASISQFQVNTRILRNETLANRNRTSYEEDFVHLGYRGKNKQTTIHVLDPKTQIMVYAEVGRSAIGCWNTRLPFREQNFDTIVQNPTTMMYPADISIDEDSVIWTITNGMPLYSQHNPNEFNYRIWKNSLRNAVYGKQCDIVVHLRMGVFIDGFDENELEPVTNITLDSDYNQT